MLSTHLKKFFICTFDFVWSHLFTFTRTKEKAIVRIKNLKNNFKIMHERIFIFIVKEINWTKSKITVIIKITENHSIKITFIESDC